MNDAFNDWLDSAEGEAFVLRCLGREMEDEGLRKSCLEIFRMCGERPRAALNALILREDWTGLQAKLQSMLRSARDEEKRDKLYERVRQVLSKAGVSCGYQPGKLHSSYGAKQTDAPVVGSWDELKSSGFAPVWPELELKDVRTTAGILELADSLQTQLRVFQGCDCRIPLRTLCGFIGARYPYGQISASKEVPGAKTSPDIEEHGSVNPEEDGNRSHTETSLCVSAANLRQASGLFCSDERLEEIAGTVACQLEYAELLLVVCLLMFCDLTLAQTARALGYAGPSGASARFQRAQAMIEELASLHEGLGGDDLDAELFTRFLGMLLGRCKDGDCSRYAQ